MCKTKILEEIEIIERSKKIYMIGKYKKGPLHMVPAAIFYLLIGFLSAGYGVYSVYKYDDYSSSALSLGIVFILLGFYISFKKDKLNC